MYEKTLTILNSKDRLPYPSIKGELIYNFWKDETNERGLWRRTSIEEYIKKDPDWETVLDLDALSEKENEKWAYKAATFLYPDNNLCLLNLSRGGSDAVEIREFDLQQKTFVMEDDSLIQLDIPEDAVFDGFSKNHMLIELKSDWTIEEVTYKQGSLIGLNYNRYLEGSRDFQVIFEPDSRSSLASVSSTRNLLLINKLTHIRSELLTFTLDEDQWQSKKVNAPDFGAITV